MKLAGDGVFGFLSGTFLDVDPREALSFSTSLDGLGGFGNELDHHMVAEVAATVDRCVTVSISKQEMVF